MELVHTGGLRSSFFYVNSNGAAVSYDNQLEIEMLNEDTITIALTSALLYDEQLVYAIENDLRVRPVGSYSELATLNNATIKIEGMERIFESVYSEALSITQTSSHYGPITCHLFWAEKDSPSFDIHTDPYDVYLKVLQGSKTMVVEGETVILTPESELYKMPANTPHRARNISPSIMLSYSTEGFLENRLW